MQFSPSAAFKWGRKLSFVLMACAAAFSVFLFDAGQAHAVYGPSTMYTPPSGSPNPGSLYGRALRLQYSGSANGTMLATFEQYVNGTPSFPIFRSSDAGKTWTQISSVTDQVNGWGMTLGAPIVRATAGNRQYAGRYDSLRRDCPSLPTSPRRNSICIRVRIMANLVIRQLDRYWRRGEYRQTAIRRFGNRS